jgi:hypothetical protein
MAALLRPSNSFFAFYHITRKNSLSSGFVAKMSHNVPAVYDVWVGIKGLCEAKTARPNVPE